VLIVEDDAIISMMLEDLVRDAGYEVYGVAATGEETATLLSKGTPDAALIDLKLRDGEESYPVAVELRRRGIPFAFVTAHDAHEINKAFAPITVLRKPVSADDVITVLRQLMPVEKS
jgi:CheY-like chemotaxis protein